MSMDAAVALDRSGDIQATANAYEELLKEERPLAILLNLALLYWVATDPGVAAGHHLTAGFLERASTRIQELLEEAHRRFPNSTAVKFWIRYIAWADFGKEFSQKDCADLLNEDPQELIPALYLFAGSNGKKAADEAEILRKKCKADGIAWARYVVSVIESVQRRRMAST